MKNDIIERAQSLCQLAPRMWENEEKAAELLEEALQNGNLSLKSQRYSVTYPKFPEYSLEADGEQIECLPSGLSSGRITQKRLIDNWHVSGRDFSEANINFNPYADCISKPTFYRAPALTISRNDVQKITHADQISGQLTVERESFESRNIVVGNIDDPDTIIFTHYDSWWGGFTDNALAVSILTEICKNHSLDDKCIVFAGSEEFSDEEKYWCYGYRRFENKYRSLMQNANSIYVVDSLGVGEPVETGKHLKDAFLLNDKSLMNKSKLLTTPPENWRSFYHSKQDTREKAKDIEKSIKFVKNKVLDR